jgi:hypothetical protein
MSTTVCLKWMSFLQHGLIRRHRAFEGTCAATLGTRLLPVTEYADDAVTVDADAAGMRMALPA